LLLLLVPVAALAVYVGWRIYEHQPGKVHHKHVHHEAPPADSKTLTLDLGGGVKMEMVLIPAGQFVMGSPEGEVDRDDSESPQHQVSIKDAFYMGKYVVTQGQWKRVLANQSFFQGDDLPAEQVSWGDCHKFCDEISRRTGRQVRLPSEAEWEYACRAGTTTAFAFGAMLSLEQANFNGHDSSGSAAAAGPDRAKTMPVGSFSPNAFGLYDMHGNVWEWCEDRFHTNYESAPCDGSAWTQGGQSDCHVRRGGAWNNAASSCRSAIRYAESEPEMRARDVGFRVVVDVGAEQ